jgi:hypothetical protein
MLHLMKRELGLNDESYRDRLERLSGQRSAKDLSDNELDQVLKTFHVKQQTNPYTAKVKALFIAAFNLGAFASGTDAALNAFVRRQTGKERLMFLTPPEANAVTEALKAILAREGCVVPKLDDGGMGARRALIRAQWRKLDALGQVLGDECLDTWISARLFPQRHAHTDLKRHELDAVAIRLGRWLRGIRQKQAKAS